LLIADFGLSRIIEREHFHLLTTMCGTPGYMAPEIFLKQGYDTQVDMWSIGVITYFLLCGYTPFDRETNAEEVQAILEADYSFEPAEYWADISDEAKDFISSLLVVEPALRLTARRALNHPWLRKTAIIHGLVPYTDEEAQAILGASTSSSDLLPKMKENFDARRKFRTAVDAVRLANKLRQEYGAVEEELENTQTEAMDQSEH
jgi:calcium/calmodulin-dependent protein kinase I